MIHQNPARAIEGSEQARMSDADFAYIARIARREFGLSLTEAKKSLVFSRLGRRLRTLNLPDFAAYFALLESREGASEMTELLSSLTTNVTKFFREDHHYDHLRTEVLPGLITRANAGGRVRLWSAGCSSGQEVYSLTLMLTQMFPRAKQTNTKVLATDIDPAILEKAKQGRYNIESLDNIPQTYRAAGTLVDPSDPDFFLIAPEAKNLITFGIANLVARLPVSGPFDVIFCRNVAIYFDRPTQDHVWGEFARLLAPGGYLYIGHSERLSGPATEQLKNIGITTYQKI